MADGKFGDITNFDHEDRQIMNLMKYYGLAQYPGLASVIRKLGSDTISIKPKSKSSRRLYCSIEAITIITTFLSPYDIMLGWKASNRFSHDREDKSAADTMREEEGEEDNRPEK